MTERAKRLTTKLKKEFGSIPEWKAEFTQTCLQAGDSDWDVTRKYHLTVHDHNKNRPLARVLHRMCKGEIGECQKITEEMIWKWLTLENCTDLQVKAKHRQEFDKAQPEVRRAKKLLAKMRRDLGDCHMVGELKILGYVKLNLTEKFIRTKYKGYIERAKAIRRAEALQYRLGDEVSRELDVSVSELLVHFNNNLKDDDIVDDYMSKARGP